MNGPNAPGAAEIASAPGAVIHRRRRDDRARSTVWPDPTARRPHPLHPSRLPLRRVSGVEHVGVTQLPRHRLDCPSCPAGTVATALSTAPPGAVSSSVTRSAGSAAASRPPPPTTARPSPPTATSREPDAASSCPPALRATPTTAPCWATRFATPGPGCEGGVGGRRADHAHRRGGGGVAVTPHVVPGGSRPPWFVAWWWWCARDPGSLRWQVRPPPSLSSFLPEPPNVRS
jgi:hypothetical protein